MDQKRFKISEERATGKATLRIAADQLAPSDAASFQKAADRLLATGQHTLLVDLCGFRSIPSVIVGVVLDAQQQARAKGQAVVLAADAATADVFRKLHRDFLEVMEPGDGPREPT